MQGLLTLAQEQFPQSAIVQARWGDYYLALNDKPKARAAYQAALLQNPEDKELLEKLGKLR